jgi:hypothetical protein
MNFKNDLPSKLHTQRSFVAPASRIQVPKQRFTPMLLKTSVEVAGDDRLKCPFAMRATATSLNPNGAVIQLARDLIVGSVVLIQNRRGTRLSARIVSCLSSTNGIFNYDVEFVEEDEEANSFWGISFPPNA